MKNIFGILIFAILSIQAKAFDKLPPNLDVKQFELLAIQDGGRVKPFDSFARESVQLITGSTSYQGKNPTELVLSWIFFPREWSEVKFFQIKHLQLKKELDVTESFISPEKVKMNAKLGEIFSQIDKLNKEKKKLNPYYQAAIRLRNQIYLYNDIISGAGIKLIPQTLSNDWLSIAEVKGEARKQFANLADAYFFSISKSQPTLFSEAVLQFKNFAKTQAPQVYPSDKILKAEVFYNKLRPFRLAYFLYFLALALFALASKKRPFQWAAITAVTLGFVVHVYGFAMRCWIAGRPPVSNMYESIIWVALGCLTLGIILELIYKKRFALMSALAVSGICLFIGDSVPMVLDQSIRPLEPVLRSNLWLTVHVLTITLSYAAFALAAGIGNYALWIYIKGKDKKESEKLKTLSLFVYRSLQVGVLLLTAGTILGGVWADYSWGRFWGWDPKETWALIADLTYLAVLHGRFTGWLKIYGTFVCSVCCFVSVIMAWYGVNFVLGVGLHSYGFGNGGVGYVAIILLIQFAYVFTSYLKFKKHI